jgi:tRNA-2-methylthio-N6-dimethylallyladenosine synthase
METLLILVCGNGSSFGDTLRCVQVLVEGPNPKNSSDAVGRNRQNKLVFFPGDGERLKGQVVTVHVDRVHAYTLFGKQVA